MKSLILLTALALALAACGNAGNDSNHAPHDNAAPGHDHFHSHAGESTELGTGKIGGLDVAVTQKGKPQRGQTLYLEVQFTGGEVDIGRIKAELVDAAGATIVATGFHPMAQAGRFGAHAALPADAPTGLIFRISHRDNEPAKIADFAIKE